MPNVCILEIKVADMQEGREFFCGTLGFKVKSEKYLPDVLVLEHEGVDLILQSASQPIEVEYPETSMSMLIFQADDIEATGQDFRRKGVEILDGPRPSPPGTFLAFRDPFGNVHGLMQLSPRS